MKRTARALALVGGIAVVASAAPPARPAVAAEVGLSASSVSLTQLVNGGPASANITVTNLGTQPLVLAGIALTGDADWSYTASAPCTTGTCTLAGGATFTLTPSFDPSAIGIHDAAIQLTSNDPNSPATITLAGIGQGATLALDTDLGTPPVLAIGPVPIGVTVQRTVRVRNDGNIALADVALTLTPAPGPLALITPSPTTVPTTAPTDIVVACTPTSAGPITGVFTATASAALTGSPLSFEVTCVGTEGSLYAVPSLVELDEIRVGSAPRSVAVELRTTGSPLTITSDPALTASRPQLALTTPGSRAIGLDAPVPFTLEVTPTVEGDLATTIGVTATGANGAETLTIPVTGRVVVARVEAPTEIMTGSYCVGQPTTAVEGALTATGSGRVGLPTQPVLAGMATSPFQLAYTSPVAYPYQLASGGRATLEIRPLRQTSAGDQADDLVWTTDIAGQEAVTTRVRATFLDDGGAITPQLIDFGGVVIGTTASPRLVRIQNCGAAPITLAAPTIAPAGEFADISSVPLPTTLAPLELATLQLGFTPRARGPRIASLTVESSQGPLTVQLRGDGIDDPARPRYTTSFYACAATEPGGAAPLLVALLGLRRRRRRR